MIRRDFLSSSTTGIAAGLMALVGGRSYGQVKANDLPTSTIQPAHIKPTNPKITGIIVEVPGPIATIDYPSNWLIKNWRHATNLDHFQGKKPGTLRIVSIAVHAGILEGPPSCDEHGMQCITRFHEATGDRIIYMIEHNPDGWGYIYGFDFNLICLKR